MAYCIANTISYSSSFNIFAVIAGVFLMKGGIKTARIIRWFSVFLVICFTAMTLLMPFSMPLDLLTMQIKLNPMAALGSYLFNIVFMGILIWIYFQLSSPQALEKSGQAGYNTTKPKSAFYAAISFVVLGVVLFFITMNGESVQIARSLAKEQLGSNYNYHTSSFRASGDHGAAVVTAYNASEIKNVQVKW